MSKFLVTPGAAVTLASGAPAGPGEEVDADPVLDKRLIDAKRLHPLTSKKPPTKAELLERAKALDIRGRTKMDPDELVAAIIAAEQKGGD